MATATEVGELKIKLTFDGSQVKAELSDATRAMESEGKKSGSKWGDAWAVAAGNLISKGISKITGMISSNMDNAIKRVDTLANADKVFSAMGYATDDVSKSMETLNGYLDGLPTSMTDAVQGVQSLASSFGGIGIGTETFMSMNNAGLAFGATTDQISGAIQQLGQLSLDGPLDAQTWNSLRNNGFGPVFTAMAKDAGMSVGELKSAFGNGELTVQDFIDRLNKLNKEGSGDMASLSELAKENTNGIGTAMENVQNRIGKAIAKIIDHIGQENISNAINNISEGFAGIADVVIKIIDFIGQNQWVIDVAIAAISGLLAMGIASKVQAFFKMLTVFATTNPVLLIIGAVVAALVLVLTHLEDIKQFFEVLVQTLVAGFQAIGQVFSDLWNGIKEGLSNIGEFFKTVFQGIWDFVTGVFSKIGGFFQGVFDTIKGIFVNIGQKIGDIIGGIIKGAVNGVLTVAENILNGPIRAVNAVLDVLNNIPGVSIGKLAEIKLPRLAQGGVTTGATAALIGEAGTEAVLPLDRNTGWATLLADTLVDAMGENGGGGVTIQHMEFKIDNKLDAEEIGQVMMTSIRRAAA